MHLVIGLGNPGARYADTRHNVGFAVVDRLSERCGDAVDRKQFGALVGSTRVRGASAVLAKPQGFMNLSGQPVASLRGFFKVDNDHIVVVHDELDLPFGEVRVKHGGGHGGHNGLRDIQQKLGGNDFVRVRVGISRPPAGWDVSNYVLGKWSGEEAGLVDGIVDQACEAVETVLNEGPVSAMNSFNTRPGRGRKASPDGSSSS